jgi:hypothetical protein
MAQAEPANASGWLRVLSGLVIAVVMAACAGVGAFVLAAVSTWRAARHHRHHGEGGEGT